MEGLLELGIFGVFVVSFLASTLLPLGSEAFVILAITSGIASFPIWIAATLGNTLGALTNYAVGYWGNQFFLSKYISVSDEKKARVQRLYLKYGAPILLFSWLPIIGDPMCIIPGVLKLPLTRFLFWVLIGKSMRYAAVILITLEIL